MENYIPNYMYKVASGKGGKDGGMPLVAKWHANPYIIRFATATYNTLSAPLHFATS